MAAGSRASRPRQSATASGSCSPTVRAVTTSSTGARGQVPGEQARAAATDVVSAPCRSSRTTSTGAVAAAACRRARRSWNSRKRAASASSPAWRGRGVELRPGPAARAPGSTATAPVRRRRRRSGSRPPTSRPRGRPRRPPRPAGSCRSRPRPRGRRPPARPPVTCSATARSWSSSARRPTSGVGAGRATARGAGAARQHRAGEPLQQPRVLAQHGLLEVAQLRARVDAQLVAQQLGAPAAGVQRLGLPVGGVERGDQPGPQPLAQRVLGDQVLQVGDGGLGPAQRPAGRRSGARGRARAARSAAAGRSRRSGGRPARPAARRATAPAPRRAARCRAPGSPAATARSPASTSSGEAQQVQVGGVGAQQVARRAGEQHRRRLARPAVGLQHPAQVGDVGLQGAGDRRRRVVAPQRADDPVDADDAAGVGQQQGQQRPGLGPADVEGPAVGTRDLERAEDSEAHDGGMLLAGRRPPRHPFAARAACKSAVLVGCKYPAKRGVPTLPPSVQLAAPPRRPDPRSPPRPRRGTPDESHRSPAARAARRPADRATTVPRHPGAVVPRRRRRRAAQPRARPGLRRRRRRPGRRGRHLERRRAAHPGDRGRRHLRRRRRRRRLLGRRARPAASPSRPPGTGRSATRPAR